MIVMIVTNEKSIFILGFISSCEFKTSMKSTQFMCITYSIFKIKDKCPILYSFNYFSSIEYLILENDHEHDHHFINIYTFNHDDSFLSIRFLLIFWINEFINNNSSYINYIKCHSSFIHIINILILNLEIILDLFKCIKLLFKYFLCWTIYSWCFNSFLDDRFQVWMMSYESLYSAIIEEWI